VSRPARSAGTNHGEARLWPRALIALLLGLPAIGLGCASEAAAYRQRQTEEHVYIGPRRSFLDRAARLLSEKGQTPTQVGANTLQTRWVLVSGAGPNPQRGAEPLVFQSYRATITSLDDLHHRIRIERGTVTTFETPSRGGMRTDMPLQADSALPGAQTGFPSIDPPVSSGVPVFVPDPDLEWELLRRTDPEAATVIEHSHPPP